MTYEELLEQLQEVDETTLLELLEITSEELVERFTDRVSEYEARIRRALKGT